LDGVSYGAFKAVDFLVADCQAAHLDLCAHLVDADKEAHGRLLVLVDEADGAEAVVPLRGQPRGEGLAFCYGRVSIGEADLRS
jgi:hypothetical protein